MAIAQILNEKGHEVTTVSATDNLQTVAKLLDKAKYGAVVALDEDGSVAGVLSERDILRQFARHGGEAVSMTVGDSMTRDVITADISDTVNTCMERMTDRRIRHLPVLDNGKLAGFISIGDLVKYKIAETQAEAEAIKSYITTA